MQPIHRCSAGSGEECRSEEGKTLDVVPVGVADQKVNPVWTRTAEHVQAELADSGTAVEHQSVSILGTYFDARSVTD
jgi:hypothetical protein